MSENVNIVRNDRGLDFGRIEKIAKIFEQRCLKKISTINNLLEQKKKERKETAFEHFGLTPNIKAIDDINKQIKELELKRQEHEEKIREFTKCEDNNYGRYDSINKKSPIDLYISESIAESIADLESEKTRIWTINEKFANELWFAKDIEHAAELFKTFQCQIENICPEKKEGI